MSSASFPFKARVLKSHIPQSAREVPIEVGSIIQIHACDHESGWWKAVGSNGTLGWVPASFVIAIDDIPTPTVPSSTKTPVTKAQSPKPMPRRKASFKERLTCGVGAQKITLFGVSLEQIKANLGQPVPETIFACIDDAKERGIHEEGIFRCSGSAADIKKARALTELNDSEFAEEIRAARNGPSAVRFTPVLDPHNTVGLLREFLRELPDGVLSDGTPIMKEFIRNTLVPLDDSPISGVVAEELHQKFLETLSQIPESSQALFVPLMGVYSAVVANEKENRMSPRALSTVVQNSLFKMPTDPEELRSEIVNSNVPFLELLLRHWSVLVGGAAPQDKTPATKKERKVRRVRDIQKCPVYRAICSYKATDPRKEITMVKNELLFRVESTCSRGWCKVARLSEPHIVRYVPVSYIEPVDPQ